MVMSGFQEGINLVDIIKGIIFKKLEFGDDAQLVVQLLPELVPEVPSVMPDKVKQGLFIFGIEEA